MQLIDGKATAAAIKAEIAEEVRKIVASGGKQPHLAAVLVGHDGGSETYVKNKVLACEACGFKSTLIRYEDDVTEEELLACVDRLNQNGDVDGFIVQLPLPKHIDGAADGTPIRIYTTDGRLVTSTALTGGSITLPATTPAGVYAVQVGTLGSTLIRK